MYYGWVIVGVGTIAMLVGAFVATSPFSAFLAPMSQDLGWSKTTLTGGQALGTLLGGLSAPLAGRLVDRYGPRVILTASGIAISLALLICANVQEPWHFFVGYGLGRLTFQGVIQVATPTAVANWFVRQRGRAMGLALMGNAVGVAIIVPITQYLIDAASWRAAWLVLAIAALVLLTPAAALLLRRRPEDLGLLPDGAAITPRTRATPPEPRWRLGAALHTRTFWLLLLSGALSSFNLAGVTTHQIPLLLQNGVPSGVAAAMVSAYAVCWMLGGVAWGFLGERVPGRYGLAAVYATGAVATLVLLHADSVGPALLFALLYGLIVGGSNTLDAVIWADYYGRESLGSIRGFGRPFQMGANALGPLFAGIAVDALGSYQLPYLGFTAIALVAALLVFSARPPRQTYPPIPPP